MRTTLDTALAGPRRARTRALLTALTGLLAAFASLGASPALAGLHKEFAVFSDCPVETPGVIQCVVSTTTSGEFVLGNATVPVSKTVTLQGGLKEDSPVLVPAADGNTLSKTPLQVPGGLIGIELLPPVTEVNTIAELAGPVELNLTNTNTGEGTAAVLPIKVRLESLLVDVLGPSCYIGSDSEPTTLNLTTGTTSPPPPNGPITGSPGTPAVEGHGKIITVHNSSLVDNSFSAPGAQGCDGLLAPVVDLSIDLKEGLPSAAGHNTAILTGNQALASVRSVVADRQLPELGRCVKAASEKVGKTTVFHGGYTDSGCVEEDLSHLGKFEWLPGAGAAKGFTGSSLGATLETVSKKRVKCAASHSSGEYTGPKSATESITFTGCKGPSGEACQSSGAGAGEIQASGLGLSLGFIKDEPKGTELILSVGWDASKSGAIVSGECGASKEALQVTGSVIAPVSVIDKPVSAYSLKYAQSGGKQLPEAFEEEPKDTLSASFGGGAGEQAGLKVAQKITNGEKLEFKAEAEE